jgi:hypothetical protein
MERITVSWVAPEPSHRRALIERNLTLIDPPVKTCYYNAEILKALDHPLLGIEMEEHFELGSRCGVRLRHPYWDADLIATLCRTPIEVLNLGNRSKGMVREWVENQVPGIGLRQQKKCLSLNFYRKRILHEARSLLDSFEGFKRLDQTGVVDGRLALAQVKGILESNELSKAHEVWSLLNLEYWLRGRA